MDFKTDSQMTVVANESVPKTQRYDEFSQLSFEKQKDQLVRAFEKRMKHAHNLFYRTELTIGYKNYNVPNSEEFVTFRRTYSHWILDRSYLMQVDILPHGNNSSQQIVTIFFDSKEGITKNYISIKNETGEILQGRIDTAHDPIILENFYTAWLEGNIQPEDFYIFPCILKYQDTWEIELDSRDKMVRLTSVYPPRYIADRYEGKRLLILDPEKDFMPLKEEYRWEATSRNMDNWVEGGFVVDDSQLIDDVWMPLKMTTHYRLKTHPDIIALFKMNVTKIEHGNVTKTDLAIKFPERTSVADMINGISYKTDANGEPIESTIEPLYGLDPSQVKLPEPPKRHLNIVFIIAGILLIVTALYLQFKKRRKSN
jgi:LPXTG-motif cell wall-anchored protein